MIGKILRLLSPSLVSVHKKCIPKRGIWWICEILHHLSIDLLFFELPINHNPPLYGCCRAATERTTVRNRRWKALKWVKVFPLIKSKTQECFLYISANYTENCFLWLRRRRWRNRGYSTSRPGCICVEPQRWSCSLSAPAKAKRVRHINIKS